MVSNIDHTIEPMKNGSHPEYPHLVYYELEAHYGSLILSAPYPTLLAALISYEDGVEMFGEVMVERGYGYATEEYLSILTEEDRF